ncbi:unnamed protein product [Adineta steineri]|uniref:ANK_REP_REGION domain-containing protein n=1 Tax=Adineta steineri TaxID=433720 RepID=A0A819EAU6_9BILA|nr:unnamed protein product [Adineta steineri]CAF3847572.1 unnamed protein product [Adineta steineri]
MPSNGNTALHEATSSGNTEIIKLLLESNAARSIKNADGLIPYDLATTEEIRQLFQRPQSHSRFISTRNSFISTLPSKLDMNCKSCSLVDDQSTYEWELTEPNTSQKAFLFRKGSCITTTTFVSTSKYRSVAENFNEQGYSLPEADDISVLCTYIIKAENRTALYIAEYSQFPPEAEVLILPYSQFRITKRIIVMINNQHPLTEIYLEQCDAPASSVDEEQR